MHNLHLMVFCCIWQKRQLFSLNECDIKIDNQLLPKNMYDLLYSLFNVQDKALNIMFDIVLRLINHWLTWKTHNIMFTVNHLIEYSGNDALVFASCWAITEKCP